MTRRPRTFGRRKKRADPEPATAQTTETDPTEATEPLMTGTHTRDVEPRSEKRSTRPLSRALERISPRRHTSLMTLLGGAIRKAWQVTDARSTSLLAVGPDQDVR